MKKLKEILQRLNNWKHVIFIVVVIGGLFYWFQIRPSNIAKKCNNEAVDVVKKNSYTGNNSVTMYDARYKSCLRSNGINK